MAKGKGTGFKPYKKESVMSNFDIGTAIIRLKERVANISNALPSLPKLRKRRERRQNPYLVVYRALTRNPAMLVLIIIILAWLLSRAFRKG